MMAPGPAVNNEAEPEAVSARVYVRLRPLNMGVIEKLAHPAYTVGQDGSLLLALPKHAASPGTAGYSFRVNGKVFDENVGNTAIYLEAVQPLVLQATEGVSSLIVAYGSSGSGKSHSLFGTLDAPGLIPSAICDLFSHIASYHHKASAFSKPRPAAASPAGVCPPVEAPSLSVPSEFSIRISYVEIRGEQIGDLLRACEGYAAGQRIPTVAPRHRSLNRELEGLKEVDLASLDEAVLLIAKASAFKKARDAVLGSAGAHGVFRVVVERAASCPPTQSKAACKEDKNKTLQDQATVYRAEITFVEAGGVETLISLPHAGGERFNRSLFFLTEILLRLAEDPSALSAFDWECSAATFILREALLAPGHLAILVNIDPSDRYTPVSLPVLRFAARLCLLRRRVKPQLTDPRRSRLFALHREVLRLSESLAAALHALKQRDVGALKPERQTEWWAPSKEEVILLAGKEDWALLQAARLSTLAAILQRVRSGREFLRQALETDAEPEAFVPHMASPRPFCGARHPSSLRVKDVYLRTKDKATTFTSIVDVPIHLGSNEAVYQNSKTAGDPFNLTDSLFHDRLKADDKAPACNVATGPVAYPNKQLNEMVKKLFNSGERASTSLPSTQREPRERLAAEFPAAAAPPKDIPLAPEGGPFYSPAWGQPAMHASGEPQPRPPGMQEEAFPPFGRQWPPHFQQQMYNDGQGPFFDAQGQWVLQQSPQLVELPDEGVVDEVAEDAGGPMPPHIMHIYPVGKTPASPARTPTAWEAVDTPDDEEVATKQRNYFTVERVLQAAHHKEAHKDPVNSSHPPPEDGHQNATPEAVQQLGPQREAEERRGYSPPTEGSSSKGETHSEGASLNEAGKGAFTLHLKRVSSRATSAHGPVRNEEREEKSKKLLKDASSLRSEVLSLIHQTSADKQQHGDSPSCEEGHKRGSLVLTRRPSGPADASPNQRPPRGPPTAQKDWHTYEQQEAAHRCCCCTSSCEAFHCRAPHCRCACPRRPPHHRTRRSLEGGASGEEEAQARADECRHGPPHWGPHMLMAPWAGAPLPFSPAMAMPTGAVAPMLQPPLCMQWVPPHQQQPAQGGPAPSAEAPKQTRVRVRPPHLTEEDRNLPRFRASKGGAAWEVAAPCPAAAAGRAGSAQDEDRGFCLPEEPRRRRRPEETKSDLLLQATLRPWTRAARKGQPALGRCLSGSSRLSYLQQKGGRGGDPSRASKRENCCLPCLGEPAQLCTTPCGRGPQGGTPPMCGPFSPPSCSLRFKSKAHICGGDSESSYSSFRGPLSTDMAPCSTYKGPTPTQATPGDPKPPSSDPPSGDVQGLAAYPPTQEAFAGHPCQGQQQMSNELHWQQQQQPPQQQPYLQQQPHLQSAPQTPHQQPQEEGHYNHHYLQQQQLQEQQHLQQPQQQQQRQQSQQPPPSRQQLQLPQPHYPLQQMQQQPQDCGALPSPSVGLPPRGPPIPCGAYISSRGAAGHLPNLGAPGQDRMPSAPLQEGPPVSYVRAQRASQGGTPRGGRAPLGQTQGGLPSRAASSPTYPAYPRGLHAEGGPLQGMPLQEHPFPMQGAPPAASGWAGESYPQPSPGNPLWTQGAFVGCQAPPQAFCSSQPAVSHGAFSPWCGGGPPVCTVVPGRPAKIVNVVSRTVGGLPTDYKPGAEKTRTVYPPQNPLDIPINQSEIRKLPPGVAPLQGPPPAWTPRLLAPWANQGAPPQYVGQGAPMLIPGQVWGGPLLMPVTGQQGPMGAAPFGVSGVSTGTPARSTVAWGPVQHLTPRGRDSLPARYPISRLRSLSQGGAPRAASPASAPPPAFERGRSTEGGTGVSKKTIHSGIGEDGEATCLEECLDLLNDRAESVKEQAQGSDDNNILATQLTGRKPNSSRQRLPQGAPRLRSQRVDSLRGPMKATGPPSSASALRLSAHKLPSPSPQKEEVNPFNVKGLALVICALKKLLGAHRPFHFSITV
ncbi:hypothetical protein Efla_003884 [Eimeria flavescens]